MVILVHSLVLLSHATWKLINTNTIIKHYNIQTLAIELCKVYLKQILGNYLQEIIMAIICVQNLILLFRKFGLYKKYQTQLSGGT